MDVLRTKNSRTGTFSIAIQVLKDCFLNKTQLHRQRAPGSGGQSTPAKMQSSRCDSVYGGVNLSAKHFGTVCCVANGSEIFCRGISSGVNRPARKCDGLYRTENRSGLFFQHHCGQRNRYKKVLQDGLRRRKPYQNVLPAHFRAANRAASPEVVKNPSPGTA
jgi:hypothetical protein